MSMAEVLATLREEVKEDDSRYLPWTCMLLKKNVLKNLKVVMTVKYFKTMMLI